MSTIYNPESETIAEIEQLEFSARQMRRRIEHVTMIADRRVLNKQLAEIKDKIEFLRRYVP
jgi:hypothetical protein